MFPYGTWALVALLIAFFLLCPIILFLIPIITAVNTAFKTTKAECCSKCNNLRMTHSVIYFSIVFPSQIIYAVLLAIILGVVGALIGFVAAALLTIPIDIFIILYLGKLALVNCKVV